MLLGIKIEKMFFYWNLVNDVKTKTIYFFGDEIELFNWSEIEKIL